jgi:hypothetical protein
MLETFFILLSLHVIADFALQLDFVAKLKGQNNLIMMAHCLIWSGLVYIGLMYYELNADWKIFFLVIGHFIIDNGNVLGQVMVKN